MKDPNAIEKAKNTISILGINRAALKGNRRNIVRTFINQLEEYNRIDSALDFEDLAQTLKFPDSFDRSKPFNRIKARAKRVSKKRMLAFKKFGSSFRLDEVILSTGEKFSGGTVLIPFYPEGYSEDAIIHLTSGSDRWSVIIYKMRKEPRVVREYVDFDAVREGNIL